MKNKILCAALLCLAIGSANVQGMEEDGYRSPNSSREPGGLSGSQPDEKRCEELPNRRRDKGLLGGALAGLGFTSYGVYRHTCGDTRFANACLLAGGSALAGTAYVGSSPMPKMEGFEQESVVDAIKRRVNEAYGNVVNPDNRLFFQRLVWNAPSAASVGIAIAKGLKIANIVPDRRHAPFVVAAVVAADAYRLVDYRTIRARTLLYQEPIDLEAEVRSGLALVGVGLATTF